MLTASGTGTITGGVESGSVTTLVQGGTTIGTAGQGMFNTGLDGGRALQLGGSSVALGTNTQFDLNAVNPNTGTSDPGAGTLAIASGATFNDETTNGGLSILASNRGTGDNGSTAAVNNQGTWKKTGSAATSVVNAAFNNSGTVDVESGTLSLNSSGAANSGKLWADGGNLSVTGAVSGTGTDEITGVSTLEFGSSVASGQAVSFDAGSTGTLRLDQSQSFAGTVAGLALSGSNFLDLSDISFVSGTTKATFSGTTSGGTLKVTDGTHTANISLLGDYTASSFVTATDNHGGTLVHDPAVALLVQAAAGFAPGANLGQSHDFLTQLSVSAHPLLVAHPV